MHTFNDRSSLQDSFRNSTDTSRTIVHIPALNASHTTKFFISLLLPFSNQICISIFLFQQPFIKLSRNSFSIIIQIINISTPLMSYLHDRPNRFSLPFTFVTFGLSYHPSFFERILRECLLFHRNLRVGLEFGKS